MYSFYGIYILSVLLENSRVEVTGLFPRLMVLIVLGLVMISGRAS